MASDIELTAETDGVDRSTVVEALRSTRTGISEQSPVSSGFHEAAVIADEKSVTVRVQGHDGEWSKETETTLRSAVGDIDGVDADSITVSGGADAPTEDTDDEGGADEEESDMEPEDEAVAADVEEIDGVGPQRAETLRAAGLDTVGAVIAGGLDALTAAGISEGVAEGILDAATDFS